LSQFRFLFSDSRSIVTPQGGLIWKPQIALPNIVSDIHARVQHHSYPQKKVIDPLPVKRDVDSLRKDVHESSVEGKDIGWGWYQWISDAIGIIRMRHRDQRLLHLPPDERGCFLTVCTFLIDPSSPSLRHL
jgi:hypothetical protein